MNDDDDGFSNSFKPKDEDFFINLKNHIFGLLIKGKKLEASEVVVDYVCKDNYFFALRDDKKEELWMYKDGIYIPEGKSYVKEFCRSLLEGVYSSHFNNLVCDKIVVDNYINHDEFFNKVIVDEIPVLNGVLNLKTKELSDFTPDKIFFTKINATYDVNNDCPKIKRFFEETLDEIDVLGMQELFGFCLWKDNFTETSFLFRANGSNGKSKTMELLKLFLNPFNCASIPLAQLEQSGSFQVSELQNKLVNVAGELSKSALKETQMFKFLTGRDPVTADRKFLRPVTFVNFSKLIFSCNDRPPTYDLSDGFFRRWIIFHYKKKFLDKDVFNALKDKKGFGIKDPDIVEHITSDEELSGLLNWALLGLERLRINKKFSNTKSTDMTRLEWVKDSNNFAVFFENNIIKSPGHLISKEDLRRSYVDFCEKESLDSVSDIAITYFMKGKGFSDAKRTRVIGDDKDRYSCWVGCRFKEDVVDVAGWSSPSDNKDEVDALAEFSDFKSNIKEEIVK